jgi:hypothetical protein
MEVLIINDQFVGTTWRSGEVIWLIVMMNIMTEAVADLLREMIDTETI